MSEAIVVTGIGIVSSLGSTCDEAIEALQAQEIGLGKVDKYQSEQLHGSVKNFKVADYINQREARKMDPIGCFTIAAGKQALDQAGLSEAERNECGLLVGTGFSGLKSVVEHQKKFLRDGIETLSPFHFPNTVYNASAGLAAIKLGVAGPNSTVTGVDVSGEQAIQYGMMLLSQGMINSVLVVGVDELSIALVKGFTDMRLLSQDLETAACPFSESRTGFNLSEGCAALLLETETAARARSAKILASIAGIGLCASASASFDYADSNIYAKKAIDQALQRSTLSFSDIDWVSCSANGSKRLDDTELHLWTEMLPQTSAKLVAMKAYTGEFASSGVLRLALGIAATQQGFIPAMPQNNDYDESIKPLLNFATQTQKTACFLHHGAGIGGSQIAIIVKSE